MQPSAHPTTRTVRRTADAVAIVVGSIGMFLVLLTLSLLMLSIGLQGR